MRHERLRLYDSPPRKIGRCVIDCSYDLILLAGRTAPAHHFRVRFDGTIYSMRSVFALEALFVCCGLGAILLFSAGNLVEIFCFFRRARFLLLDSEA